MRGLASWLLSGWHEDGVAGMDRVCGNLRQVGRQLDYEIWPLASLAAVWFAKIVFTGL